MKTTVNFSLAKSAALVATIATLMLPLAKAAEPPTDVPPTINNPEEGSPPPAVTTQKKASTQAETQTKQTGEQTEVKVTTGVGTYVVKSNQNVGNSQPGDAQSSSNHPAQWVVKSWGGAKKAPPSEVEEQTLPPNPNAQPATPK